MKSAIKKIAAFGAFAALAAVSNASIVINIPTADGYDTGDGTAVVHPASFSDYSVFSSNGSSSISGSFTFLSTVDSIVQIASQVKSNTVSLGTISFDANVAGVGSVLSRTATEVDGDNAGMSTAYQFTNVSLAANTVYTLNWVANYTGTDEADSYAAISQADFIFKERGTQPVPEPASMAALGVGLAGVIARRRKGAK